MDYDAILDYFNKAAGSGRWGYLYNRDNPNSYSFIARLKKAVELAGPFNNKRALDLGCGTGALIPFVMENNGYYIGLDVSEKMLDEVKKAYPEFVSNKNVSFIYGDVRHIQLPVELDSIIGLGFIEYFDKPLELIKLFYDKLKKDGHLILSFPNFHSLDSISVRVLTPLRFLARVAFGRPIDQPPRLLWSVKAAKAAYLKAGFRNIKIVNYNINIFCYPFTRMSTVFTNFWAERFEYSFLSRHSFFATGFLIKGEK